MFQIPSHGPMVRPFIGHEFMKIRAGIFAAKAAKINTLGPAAIPEPTVSHPVVDSSAQAAITIVCPTGAAVEPTWTIG